MILSVVTVVQVMPVVPGQALIVAGLMVARLKHATDCRFF